jgi:molybdate transport system substrate-binding protein
MKRRAIPVWFVVLTVLFAFITGCGSEEQSGEKELLIYCGITMIKPMSEIADIIEEQENCKITITQGGSGNLLRSIQTNKVGDLFLPGSDSYIKTAMEEGLVSETVHVGYNKAAMMVQEGNPKGITADLENMANSEYYVVIGDPESGSIGQETQKILEAKGIYQEVVNNAHRLTTDSKDLVAVLADKEADLVINWYATSTWPENESYVDALQIDEAYAQKKRLVIGLLTMSRYPDIARKFMEYAASEAGQELFKKYGLQEPIP